MRVEPLLPLAPAAAVGAPDTFGPAAHAFIYGVAGELASDPYFAGVTVSAMLVIDPSRMIDGLAERAVERFRNRPHTRSPTPKSAAPAGCRRTAVSSPKLKDLQTEDISNLARISATN